MQESQTCVMLHTSQAGSAQSVYRCSECNGAGEEGHRFCPFCGAEIVRFDKKEAPQQIFVQVEKTPQPKEQQVYVHVLETPQPKEQQVYVRVLKTPQPKERQVYVRMLKTPQPKEIPLAVRVSKASQPKK